MANGYPWQVFVDGAYSKQYPNCVSIAFVIIDRNTGNKWKYATCYELESIVSLKNVGAEILSAYLATKAAVMLGCKKLTIYHDYAGISCWVLGHWRAQKEATQTYTAEMRKFIDNGIEIQFKHVAAHTGNAWNEYVDQLAGNELIQYGKEMQNNVGQHLE